MISDYSKLAVRNLGKRKLRSWLTMIGIFISIATIFVLISVSLGLKGAVEEQFRVLGTDKFFIMPKGQLGGPGTSSAVFLQKADADAVERVAGVKDISYISVAYLEVIVDSQKRFFMAAGMQGDKMKVLKEVQAYKIDEGRFWRDDEYGKAFIGSQYKYNNIFKKPMKTGDKMTLNGVDFKVVGILQPIGNSQDDKLIYMQLDDLKKITNITGIDEIIIQVNEGESVSEVAANVEKKLRSFRGVNEKTQDFSILTPEELLATIGTILNVITAFLLGVAAISLVVGAIGIANTMYTSVLERINEIGVMKAVGARNSDIMLIFLIESGLLGLVGGIIGVALGATLSKMIEYIAITQFATTLLKAAMPLYLFAGCLVFAFVVGAISGVFPAYRASKIKPVEALRYE
jgi:putative ABC transport system permease protein